MFEDATGKPRIYNISPGVPFARALAGVLLARSGDDPQALSGLRLLLPTRRACRTLQETFLSLTGGRPLLLPQLQPLGDVDEEELTLTFAGLDVTAQGQFEFDLPPAMPPLRRQILLARAVMSADRYGQGPDHAMALAGALGRLMDKIYTENLDLADLPDLVTGDFARHWEITLDFLKILSEEWPSILDKHGMIDEADRRNRLLNLLAAHWQEKPPAMPVIAAGSTGSIPATGNLLKVIAHLPQGAIILPGLDQEIDDESWQAIDDTHPQATLKQLLDSMNVKRTDVQPWCDPKRDKSTGYLLPRRWLIREVMRPASTTAAWANLAVDDKCAHDLRTDIARNVVRFDCSTPQEEADIIALVLREVLEEEGKTATLVTPDRQLARRVMTACRRWGLTLDDSGGQPLADSAVGSLVMLAAQVWVDEFSPISLLSMLRHRLCSLAMVPVALRKAVNRLEIGYLRGTKPGPGFAGIRSRVAEKEMAGEKQVKDLLDTLEQAFAPLLASSPDDKVSFAGRLRAHIAVMENLAEEAERSGQAVLWSGDAGETAALFLARLHEQADLMPDVNGAEYLAIVQELMKGEKIRVPYGLHPRLRILGQLEARLLQADLVILGGLNEGTWPADPGHDPWMSRPMMARYGLPLPERSIGLSAHDFVQGFCAPRLVLTRAGRVQGTPTVPARWLQRLDTVLEAMGIAPGQLKHGGERYYELLQARDHADVVKSFERPAPRPPVALRPRELPVTAIETWLADPYGVYARYVLRLRKLDELERPPDAAERGSFLHDVMDRFIQVSKDDLPADSRMFLLETGRTLLAGRTDDPGFWDFWWPRFERIAGWVADYEKDWRNQAKPLAGEVKGRMTILGPAGAFVLKARADRIDLLSDRRYAVIDYKTGGNFSKKAMIAGELPQLPLEGLILKAGGFESVPAGETGYLGYWILKGGESPGETTFLSGTLDGLLEKVEEGLTRLIALYDEEQTSYFCLPDPDYVPRFNDYEQLARVQEWTALDEAETGEAA